MKILKTIANIFLWAALIVGSVLACLFGFLLTVLIYLAIPITLLAMLWAAILILQHTGVI